MKQVQRIFHFKKMMLSQSGQAVVEYVLVLIVSIAILLAAAGFATATKTFISTYVGDYFKCLMDYGELPALSVANSDLKKHADGGSYSCRAQFKFSLKNGFEKTAGASSQAGSQGGRDKSTADKSTQDKEREIIERSQKKSTSSNDSSSAGAASTYGSSGGRFRKLSGYGTGDGELGTSSSKRKILEGSSADDGGELGNSYNRYGSSSTTVYQYKRYKAITGKVFSDEALKEKGPKFINRSTASSKAEEEGFKPRVAKFTPPVQKTAQIDESSSETSFDFSQMVKWLFIIGMLIALILFFGGQALSYSKSDSS